MRYVVCPNCGIEVEIPRCEFCSHLDFSDKKSIGYRCTCPNKIWPHNLSMYKNKGQPACQYYVANLNRINEYVGDVIKR